VWGSITVFNPNDEASATVTGVSDALDGVDVDVDCGDVVFPYELAAGASLVCSYETTLDSGETVKNVATATTSGDVEGGSGSVWVEFASHWGEIEEGMDYGSTNYCVDVVDNMGDASIHDQEDLTWLARVCVVEKDPQTEIRRLRRADDGRLHARPALRHPDRGAAPGASTSENLRRVRERRRACVAPMLVNRAKVLVYGGVGYVEAYASVWVVTCPVEEPIQEEPVDEEPPVKDVVELV
jgi:hypothetical protein